MGFVRRFVFSLSVLGLLASPSFANADTGSGATQEVVLSDPVFLEGYEGLAKWDVSLRTVLKDGQVFKGFKLWMNGVDGKEDNVWYTEGSFAIVPGKCASKPPAGSEFKRFIALRPIKYPHVLEGEATQGVCVWGKLSENGLRVVSGREPARMVEEALKVKGKYARDAGAFYKNTATVSAVGTVSGQSVNDNDFWESFVLRYPSSMDGSVRLFYEPNVVNAFAPLLPLTGGYGTRVFVVGGLVVLATSVLGYLVSSRVCKRFDKGDGVDVSEVNVSEV